MEIVSPKASDIPALRELWKEAFGDTDVFLNNFFGTAFSTERARCVKDNGKVAAALYWFDCEREGLPVAYIYAVATLTEYRGRGFCHALMQDTHEVLIKRGYKEAIVVPASAELFDFYAKMGYTVCSFVDEIEAEADGDTIMLRKIDEDEYSSVRRSLLPEDAVIQENENIAFLKTMSSFYSGEGFVLAASVRAGELYVTEYLGDKTLIPHILQTIGYKNGIFRMPGKEKAFAMSLSFNDDETSAISYFGLAFD